MGNSSSSSLSSSLSLSGGRPHHDDSVDCGFLVPNGVYTGPRDWNHAVVSQLIVARRLAPFYPPLEEYDASWDDSQILAARKEFPPSTDTTDTMPPASSRRRSIVHRNQPRPEMAVYRGAVECPICFLYYPPNINYSRCCDQAICTECFVQIKRTEPTTTRLVSEPAACPYCVQDNFGIVYRPPHWRVGIGSDGSTSQAPESPRAPPSHRRRQQSYSADSPEVVLTDQIRPDWEAKLAAVRAAVARRANRRIIMRQVGDRLIPVGVSSGRVHALNPEDASVEAAEGGGGSRRRRRGGLNSHLDQLMSIPGQDFEEIMIMEAMRLSLIEHEGQQRKEAEERRKQEAAAAAEAGSPNNNGFTAQPAAAGPSSTLPTLPSQSSTFLSSSQASLVPVSKTPTSAATQNKESDTGQQQRKSQSNSRSRLSDYGSNSNSTSTQNQRTIDDPLPPTAATIWGSPISSQSQESRLATSSSTSVPPISTSNTHTSTPPSNSSGNNDQEEDRAPAIPPKSIPNSNTTFSVDTSASMNTSNSSLDPRNCIDRSSYKQLSSSPESGNEIMNKPLLAVIQKDSDEGRNLSGDSVLPQDGPMASEGVVRDE